MDQELNSMERVKLKADFFNREDVVQISKELLGKYLVTHIDGHTCVGLIAETEAYAGITDRACHAFGNRRTQRTEVMYHEGGIAYVYLCYGIHHLFNIVTNKAGIPHAVLIRSLLPVKGIPAMLERRNLPSGNTKNKMAGSRISNGPGTLSQAMGMRVTDSGTSLRDNRE